MSFVMQRIECHYNVYNFTRRALITGRFGLTLAYEDGTMTE